MTCSANTPRLANPSNVLFSCSVHVRRTDKVGTEAAFHSIDEYMHHVIEWFTLYEKIQPPSEKTNPPPRRVYLATDEPSLLAEAKKK